MSEFTAVGPAFDLDGPLPVAPPHSLLETELLDEDGNRVGVVVERDATRVLNGVNVYSYPTGCPGLWEPCSDGTFRTKSADADWPLPRFDSIGIGKLGVGLKLGSPSRPVWPRSTGHSSPAGTSGKSE